jgi:large conductance mechanosensitive channel
VGIVTQSLNFSGLALRVGASQIAYGKFLQAVISFLLVAVVSFLLVRMVNQMQRRLLLEKSAAPTTVPKDVQLLSEIRDRLQAQTRPTVPDPPAETQTIQRQLPAAYIKSLPAQIER